MAHKHVAFNIMLVVVALTLAFVGLVAIFDAGQLLLILNGLFVGSMVGILITYWRLVSSSVVGSAPYDRARQMALGLFVIWLAYTVGVLSSIYYQSTGVYRGEPQLSVSVSRYLAIVAAWLQITALDFGHDMLYGRNRKVLLFASVIGLAVSVVIVMAQEWSWLR